MHLSVCTHSADPSFATRKQLSPLHQQFYLHLVGYLCKLSAVVCKPQRGISITCGQMSAPHSGEFCSGSASGIGVVFVLLCFVVLVIAFAL